MVQWFNLFGRIGNELFASGLDTILKPTPIIAVGHYSRGSDG
jgi:hypothetical protein